MNQPFHNLADSDSERVSDRKVLRAQLRQARRSLNPQQQARAASRLATTLTKTLTIARARNIALYIPNDGEIDPRVFMTRSHNRNLTCFLPVLHPIHSGQLAFCRYNSQTPMVPNRFGIPEPRFHHRLLRPAWSLDAVLMPLVGFDAEGGRLGMGGGFYDRTFAFTRLRPRLRPMLIGVAHELQKVEKLPVQSWDIPLDAIVTDRAMYRVS